MASTLHTCGDGSYNVPNGSPCEHHGYSTLIPSPRQCFPRFPHGRRSGNLKMGWATLGCRSPEISRSGLPGGLVIDGQDGILGDGLELNGRFPPGPVLHAICLHYPCSQPRHHARPLPLSVPQSPCPCLCSVNCPYLPLLVPDMTLMYSHVPACRKNTS